MAGEGREKCVKIWGEAALQRWCQGAGTRLWLPALSQPGWCMGTGKESLVPYPHVVL